MADPELTPKLRTFRGIAPGVIHLENVVELGESLVVCSPQKPYSQEHTNGTERFPRELRSLNPDVRLDDLRTNRQSS